MKELLFALLVLISPLIGWGHGADKPGPHGGFITMPGPFHVELRPKSEQSFEVFLLDMNFQNPAVKDSQVEMSGMFKNTQTSFKCTPQDTYFLCVSDKKLPPRGELIIQATREKAVGNKALYKVPLKIQTSRHP